MTDARTHILAKLERVIDRKDAGSADADSRISLHIAGPIPRRGTDETKPEQTERFVREAMLAGADVHELISIEQVPVTVVAYLRAKNLPLNVRVSADGIFENVRWNQEPGLEIENGGVEATDTASLSAAASGVAETGTLVMASSPENPAMYGFVPLLHMVLLPESCIHGSYEDAWIALRQRQGNLAMPRMVNMITGPSRTADIEQTLLMGAHGPQNLMIMIVGGT